VALAGGPGVVATRAQEKLAAGAPLEALQLIEAALATDPRDARALDVSLAVHRALREKSVNFWESAWLDREIRTLEVKRAEAPRH
jgi:hypothetical protein